MRIGSKPMTQRKYFTKTMKCQFSMWQSCLYVLVLLWLFQSALAEVPESRKKQLIQLVDDDRYDCKYLLIEEREFLKGYFYEVKKRTNPQAHNYQLLQVGDEPTIERYIREFELTGSNDGGYPSFSGQARFIEVYAPALFRDEKLIYSQGDARMPPLSYGLTYDILRLLRESPQLAPNVRHWALSLDENELEKNRTLLQKWWRANERHFHEHNYQAVQPPAESVTPPSATKASLPSTIKPRPTAPPQSASAAPEAATQQSSLAAGFIAAICATLLAIAYWLHARRNETQR